MNRKGALIFVSGLLVLFTSLGALLARANPKGTPYNYLTIFSNVIHLVDSNYVEEVDFNKVMDSAMTGMVESLDSESYFIQGKEIEAYKKSIEESRTKSGVGLTLSKRFGMVVVVAVDKGSSADEKKIKAGDFIRSVNDQYVQGMPLYRIYGLIKGDSGTEVKVSIFKGALEKPQDFVLVRKAITKPYIDAYVAQPKIGYARINHLLPGTENELEKKLDSFGRQGVGQMILDLRGCTEEEQDVAVKVAGLFMGAQPIVQVSGRNGSVQTISGQQKKSFSGELLVLIDYTSAGGSEIIAGAIQDSGAGKAYGQRTFGKGGIQKLLPAGENFVVLTTQRYLTPKGKSILVNGIEPSIPFKEDLRTVSENEDTDEMLNSAIEYLRHSGQKAA